jgi:hypothetical protein
MPMDFGAAANDFLAAPLTRLKRGLWDAFSPVLMGRSFGIQITLAFCVRHSVTEVSEETVSLGTAGAREYRNRCACNHIALHTERAAATLNAKKALNLPPNAFQFEACTGN